MMDEFMKDKEQELGFEENCPNCNSKNIVRDMETEYTGGGYADSWETYECQDCGHVWQGEVAHGYS